MFSDATTALEGARDILVERFAETAELLATLRTPSYLARVSVHEPKAIMNAKKAIRKAFKFQIDKTCFSLVEVVSTCPTGWGQQPHEACEWLEEHMLPYFPLGDVKTPEAAH